MPSNYGKYFLAYEADDEEEVNQDQPETEEPEAVEEEPVKSNLRKITVEPSRRSFDFTKIAKDDFDSEETEPLSPEEDPYALAPGEDPTMDLQPTVDGEEVPSFTDDNEQITPDLGGEGEMPPAEGGETPVDNGDMPPAEGTADAGTENPTPEAGGETPTADAITTPAASGDQAQVTDGDLPEGETPPSPEEQGLSVGDDVDFTDDVTGGEGETGDLGGEGEMPAEGGETQKGPGLEYDSTRKYVLFKNFISLNNAIDTYIDKLNTRISNNPEEDTIIKVAIQKFKETSTELYDYLTMRYEASTYTQSLIFYQNRIVQVQLIIDMLSKIGKKINSSTK
jgi:hypothetical protein